jgi:uncharacterized protein (TIGR03437 family)
VSPSSGSPGQTITLTISGLNCPGLYQFNVVVPSSAASGDNTVTATDAGSSTPAAGLIAVQR